jgi:ABC-type phosphate/phosphonate transport system substrate-binding protein
MVKGVDGAAAEMKADRIQMAVVHGWEYAWLQEQCPDVEPLLVAINDVTTQKVHVLVAKDNPAKTIADLKGQSLAVARRLPNFVKFYLERLATEPGEEFFAKQVEKDTDAGIEAVIEGKAKATAVSTSALNVYKNRKPVRAERFRILQESATFPPPVLAYRKGKVKEDTLKRFRDAMLKAHESTEGRQTMTLWRLSSFQPVPNNYQQLVQDIRKEYPPKK